MIDLTKEILRFIFCESGGCKYTGKHRTETIHLSAGISPGKFEIAFFSLFAVNKVALIADRNGSQLHEIAEDLPFISGSRILRKQGYKLLLAVIVRCQFHLYYPLLLFCIP